MARLSRVVVPGWLHHLTQRGNHRQAVFFEDRDRLVYLSLLSKCLSVHEIALIGYCLMENHVHLSVIPGSEQALAEGIGRMHRDFARWQNIQCNTCGHLWQNRFYSCPVEEDRIWGVLSYIELNPVRAGLVRKPWDWKWSSALAHVTGSDPLGILEMEFWRRHFSTAAWREYLEQVAADKVTAAQIRTATAAGRLLGSDSTARKLEKELNRPILAKRRGRKPGTMPRP